MPLNYVSIPCVIFGLLMLALERARISVGDGATLIQIIGLCIFLIYLRCLYKDNRGFVFASFYQVFYLLGMLLSGLILSLGVPMIEIGENGTSNGTFWVVFVFGIIGLLASRVGFKKGVLSKLGSDAPRFSINVEKIICHILAIMPLLFSVVVYYRYGAPGSNEVDRTIFWNESVPFHFSWVNTALKQMFFFVSLIFLLPVFRGRFLPSLYVVLYVFFTIFLLGEKASAFFILISMFLIIYSSLLNPKVDYRALILSACVVLFIISLILFNYRENNYGDAFFWTRIALQAQVLWSSLNMDAFPFLASESIFTLKDFSSSADFVSYRLLPTYLYEYYAERGNTLSGFMPAFYIIFFGYLGAILIHAFVSLVAGYLAGISISAIRSQAFFVSFLWIKIHFALIFSWYALIYSALFGWVFIFGLLLMFFMYHLKRPFSGSKNG